MDYATRRIRMVSMEKFLLLRLSKLAERVSDTEAAIHSILDEHPEIAADVRPPARRWSLPPENERVVRPSFEIVADNPEVVWRSAQPDYTGPKERRWGHWDFFLRWVIDGHGENDVESFLAFEYWRSQGGIVGLRKAKAPQEIIDYLLGWHETRESYPKGQWPGYLDA